MKIIYVEFNGQNFSKLTDKIILKINGQNIFENYRTLFF
jgi:hypothetical protein